MSPLEIACGIVAPAIFWIGYLYYKDRYQPEPVWAVGTAYVLGIGMAYVATWAYDLSTLFGLPEDPFALAETNRLAFLVYAIGFVGVVEELLKLLPFWLIVMRLRAFDEVLDGIVYASAIALGYATLENVFFLPELESTALYGRAFAAPLVHTMFSSIWGYALARARFHGRSPWIAGVVGLSLAALVHGLYDYVSLDPVLQPAAALAILVVWVWRIRVVESLHRATRNPRA
jgi:RsiW-degrading membrane proteinase PrsW (M82 family)